MKRIFLIVVTLAVIGLGAFLVSAKLRATNSADLTQYKVTVVQAGAVKKTVSATGTP